MAHEALTLYTLKYQSSSAYTTWTHHHHYQATQWDWLLYEDETPEFVKRKLKELNTHEITTTTGMFNDHLTWITNAIVECPTS